MGILSNLVIAVSGTLPEKPQNIKKWVEANDGKWSPNIKKGSTITHLIASKEAWATCTEAVHKGLELGAFIVSYDWLEDSLHRKRKLSEKKYAWEVPREARRTRKELKRLAMNADPKNFRDGCMSAKALTGSGMSKQAPTLRRPKKSSSFFFQKNLLPQKPFDSAVEALKKTRMERDNAQQAAAIAPDDQIHASIETKEEIESFKLPWLSSVAPSSTAVSELMTQKIKLAPFTESAMEMMKEKKAKNPNIKDIYHYYQDSVGFEYRVKLTRSNLSSNNFAQYHIGLLESHTKPHAYCTVIKYLPPAKRTLETITPNRDISSTGLRNPLLNFLREAESNTVQQRASMSSQSSNMKQIAGHSPVASCLEIHPPSTQPTLTIAEQEAYDETIRARLTSLIEPSTPCTEATYAALICPMNSPFPCAWRAFRHAFRDITLLSWEERFESGKTIQISRAKQLGIEPFIYAKPMKGSIIGLFPQEPGLFYGTANGLEVIGEADDGYTRNAFNLPALAQALSENGGIGSELYREEEKMKRQIEEERRKAEEKERGEKRKGSEGTNQKKVNFNKPFFNCTTGTPVTDAYGRYTRNTTSNGNIAGAKYLQMVKKRKLFPSERLD